MFNSIGRFCDCPTGLMISICLKVNMSMEGTDRNGLCCYIPQKKIQRCKLTSKGGTNRSIYLEANGVEGGQK